MRRRPYRAGRSPVTVRSIGPGAGAFSRTIRDGSQRKELSVSEYQGNDETAALEDEEVATPTADTAADQPGPGSMEDDETTWDD
jgi:hypothetical protein